MTVSKEEKESRRLPWLNLLAIAFAAGSLYGTVYINSANIEKVEQNVEMKFTTVLNDQTQSNKELTRSLNQLNVTMSAFGESLKNRDREIRDLQIEVRNIAISVDKNHDSLIRLEIEH